jgi:hypothetical protein
MRLTSRFASCAPDDPPPANQRVKFFKELARLRASEPPKNQPREAPAREAVRSEPRSLAEE